MPTARLNTFVRRFCNEQADRQAGGPADAELWARYVHARDEAAFAALVRRHGPMVLAVCRRILHLEQDAEDAFQATFLVLVRKASSLRSPSLLASWLHGVARRTALEARSLAARRRARESAVSPLAMMSEEPGDDLRPVLDQELGRLPENYRVAVVLCDLEGKTRKEAARQLGWAEGTVASRLARGRGLLAQRLARRGFAGAVVAAAVTSETAPAAVPPDLFDWTITAVHSRAARGVLSHSALTLAEGVLKSMTLTKLKSMVTAVFLIGLITAGASSLLPWGRTAEPARPDDVHDRVSELKQQLQDLQAKIANLERETPSRPAERPSNGAVLAERFKYRVPFEIGFTESHEGGRIEIQEVWGTRPTIEVGGQYLVRGRYVLPPGAHAKLYFYVTAGGDWGHAALADLDLQSVTLDKERGEFALVHGMSGPGNFHLYLAPPERYSRTFANVYFGTGDNVWRKKP